MVGYFKFLIHYHLQYYWLLYQSQGQLQYSSLSLINHDCSKQFCFNQAFCFDLNSACKTCPECTTEYMVGSIAVLVKMASKKRQSSLTTLLCLALGVILNDYQVKLLSQSSWGGQAPLSEKLGGGGPWPPWPPHSYSTGTLMI